MTQTFNYFEVAPQHWAEQMRILNADASGALSIPCLWGVHEQIKGIRDFARSPKVRLEKLFSEAKQNKIKIELCLGFPPHPLAFPQWTFGNKEQGLCPALFWNSQDQGYRFRTIPSFLNSEFQQGFLDFVEEALSVVSLYAGDGGPIEKIRVSFGVLNSDLALATTPSYLDQFKVKYATPEALNTKFSTTFRSFPTAHPDQLFRSLFEKRPWITAYDYRVIREFLLNKFKSKIERLPSAQQLGREVLVFGDRTSRPQDGKSQVVIDSTFLDLNFNGIAPFFPEKVLNSMSAFANRIAEFCESYARREDFDFVGISELKLLPQTAPPFIMMVSGKYTSTATVRYLSECAQKGASVFFPFGIPLFSEDATEISWPNLGQKEVLKKTRKPLTSQPIGKGRFLSPVASIAIDEKLAHSLNEYRELIQEM